MTAADISAGGLPEDSKDIIPFFPGVRSTNSSLSFAGLLRLGGGRRNCSCFGREWSQNAEAAARHPPLHSSPALRGSPPSVARLYKGNPTQNEQTQSAFSVDSPWISLAHAGFFVGSRWAISPSLKWWSWRNWGSGRLRKLLQFYV